MGTAWQLDLGARMIEANCGQFKVWAPFARTVAVELMDQDRMAIPMQPASDGYFEVTPSLGEGRARCVARFGIQ